METSARPRPERCTSAKKTQSTASARGALWRDWASRTPAPTKSAEKTYAYEKDVPEIGTFVNVKITQADTYDLMGEML